MLKVFPLYALLFRFFLFNALTLPQQQNHSLSLCFSQGSVPLEPSYIVGHVASAPKEQNLTTLFNDGENSQVCLYVKFELKH